MGRSRSVRSIGAGLEGIIMSAATLALSLLAVSAPPASDAVGVNLDFHRSWAGHLMFVDAMMRSREWVPFVPGSEVWDSGAPVPTGPRGYPLRVPFVPPEGGPPQRVRTLVFDDLAGHYPGGTYTLELSGKGRIAISGDTQARVLGPGRHPIEVRPGEAGLTLEIRRSDEDDPLRDIHLWLPGFEGAKDLLHPEMVTRLRGFSVIRPTQTMSVNGGDYPCDNGAGPADPSCVQGWDARPTPDFYTQATTRGVAIEHLVELAQAAGTDLWPGIPHAADDGWVRGLAEVIRDRLEPGRRVYVELSNEIWNFNGHYPQHDYFRAVGRMNRMFPRDMPEDDTDAGRRAYVKRAVEVWRIFHQVLGDTHQVVKVMPGFFGNPWHSDRMLDHLRDEKLNPKRIRADALAVGAYFGGAVADALVAEGKAKSTTVDEVLDRTGASLGTRRDAPDEETFAGYVRAHVSIAKRHRLPLIAYEGGQHLVVGTGEPSPINEVLHAANRDPRMAELYARAFDLWYGMGGELFVVYGFVQPYSRWGAFGHLEYMYQPIEEAPKFEALRTRMRAFGVELPQARLRLPLGRPWTFLGTGSFPGTGVLLPLDEAPLSAPPE